MIENMNTAVRKDMSASDRIYVRGLESDIALAKHRAAKYLKAGEALRADIQSEIATEKGVELARFLSRRG